MEVIGKTPELKYIDDDNKLINYLTNKLNPGDVVVFWEVMGLGND